MTEKQIKQIRNLLPQSEKLDRMYSAYEGGIRAISKDAAGNAPRYQVHFGADGSVSIERM